MAISKNPLENKSKLTSLLKKQNEKGQSQTIASVAPTVQDLINVTNNVNKPSTAGDSSSIENVSSSSSASKPKLKGGTYQGGTMSEEEFRQYKSAQGFSGGSGMPISPAVQAVLDAENPILQQRLKEQEIFNRIQAEPTDLRNIDREGNVIDTLGTGAAALAGGLLGAKSGAATGAFLAPFTGGASVPIGAALGGIGGAIGAAFIKISAQERQDVKKANKVFTTAKTNQNEILDMVNAGIISRSEAVELWEDEKLNIYSVEANLKKRTSSDLQDFLSDPGDELAAVEARVRLQPYLDTEFQLALVAPDPTKIKQRALFDQTIGE